MSGELGRLVLQFAANVAGFQSDLGRIERAAQKSAKETAAAFDKAMDGVADSIKGAAAGLVAAFTVDAFRDFIKNAIDAGDAIQDLSDKVGIGVSELAGLKFAAEQNGGSVDILASAIKKLSKAQTEALGGNEKLTDTFSALGISLDDLSAKGADQIFVQLADQFSQIEDAALRVTVAQKLFGKSGTELIPTLVQGSDALRQQTQEFERLAGALDESTTQGFAQFNDQLDKIQTAATGLGTEIASALLPALQQGAESLTEFLVQAREEGTLQSFAVAVGDVARALITLAEITGKVVLLVSDLTDGIDNLTQKTLSAVPVVGELVKAYSLLNNLDPNPQPKGVGRPFEEQGSPSTLIELYKIGSKVADEFRLRVALAGKSGGAAGEELKRSAPKVREFVEAVRVLSLDKTIVGTPKELALAIRDIREELNPTLRITREYDEKIKALTASTAADTNQTELNERAKKKLTAQRDRDIAAIQRTTGSYQTVIESLQREAAALKGSAFDREKLAESLRIEAAFREAVSQATQDGTELTEKQTEAIRKQVEELDKLANKKTFNFAAALSDAINEGFAKGSVSAGFKNLIKQIKEAFSTPEGAAGAIASIANGLNAVITAAQNSDGNSTGAAIRAGVDLLAQNGNVFAQAAQAIDALFKGKLFGTDFARQSQTNTAAFGPGGFSGTVQTVDTRQRSFFRGTQTRRTTSQADAAALEAGANFQAALDDISRTISDAFGTTLSARVTASFVQTFDKNGLASTIATVGGRAVAAGTQQAFEQFLTAQTIIDALGPSISGLDALADPFRATGQTLLEFAQFAFATQTDLAQGAELLGPGSAFAQILPVIEDLARGGESLSEAYKRVRDGAQLLDDALAAIGETSELARVDFVKFTADLVVALGGLNNATAIIGRTIAEFFSPDELRATRLTSARNTLNDLGESTGLGILTGEAFKEILSQALAGAFDAERTADILAYGDALATVNGLVRETTAANEAAVQAEIDRVQAIKDASAALGDFVLSLQEQAADGSLTDYQRTLRTLNQQYQANAQSLLELARSAGLTAAPIEGVTANLSILAQGAARALADLKVSVLQGLDSLFGSQQLSSADAFNAVITGNIIATQNWAEQLKELETLQSTQDLARNIADLFDASGLSFADGVEQYAIPLRSLLDNLGVNFANLTDTASIDAFGAAASLLGVSADELASIAGIDLSGLTDAQIAALDIASAPQLEAAESSANSLASIDEKSTSMVTLLMQQNTATREQADTLARLGANFNSLSDEVRRLANRVTPA